MGLLLDVAAFDVDAVIELKDVAGVVEVPAEDGFDVASADVDEAVGDDDVGVAAAGAGAHVESVVAADVAGAPVGLQHDADAANVAVAAVDVVQQELDWLVAPRLMGQGEPFLYCWY